MTAPMTDSEFVAAAEELEAGVTRLRRRFVHVAAVVLIAILIVGTVTTSAAGIV